MAEHLLHERGHRLQFAILTFDLVWVFGAAGLCQRETDEVVRGELRQECLGGRNADLRPGSGVEHGVGFARNLAAVGVADCQHLRLLCFGVPDRLQGVGGLAGLRNGDHQGAAVQNRVTVTEFTGQLDLHWQPGPMLDGVLG